MLNYIFELLCKEELTKLPISKALLPYQRRVLFRDVILTNDTLSPFVRSMKENPALGALVRSIEMDDYKKASIQVSVDDFRSTLAALVNVQNLKTGSNSTLNVVKSEKTLSLYLHTLTSLDISLNVDLLDRDPLRHLHFLPELHTLSVLLYTRPVAPLSDQQDTPPHVQAPFTNVKSLVAVSELNRAETRRFISRFTSLTSATIVYAIGHEDPGRVLEYVSDRVSDLGVGGIPLRAEWEAAGIQHSFGNEIGRFGHLRTLEVVTPDIHTSFYAALIPLPLEHVGFHPPASPNLEALVRFVSESRTLRTLEITCFDARLGRPLQPGDEHEIDEWSEAVQLGYLDDDDDLPSFPIEGWELARWTEDFPAADAGMLAQAAAAAQVELKGTFARAVVVPDTLRRQLSTLRTRQDDTLFHALKTKYPVLEASKIWETIAALLWCMLVKLPPGTMIDLHLRGPDDEEGAD